MLGVRATTLSNRPAWKKKILSKQSLKNMDMPFLLYTLSSFRNMACFRTTSTSPNIIILSVFYSLSLIYSVRKNNYWQAMLHLQHFWMFFWAARQDPQLREPLHTAVEYTNEVARESYEQSCIAAPWQWMDREAFLMRLKG